MFRIQRDLVQVVEEEPGPRDGTRILHEHLREIGFTVENVTFNGHAYGVPTKHGNGGGNLFIKNSQNGQIRSARLEAALAHLRQSNERARVASDMQLARLILTL